MNFSSSSPQCVKTKTEAKIKGTGYLSGKVISYFGLTSFTFGFVCIVSRDLAGMDTHKGRFRLKPASSPQPITAVPSSPIAPPTIVTFRAFDPPPTALPGTYESDCASENYNLSWRDWNDFDEGLPEYERQLRYVCSRAGTGGRMQMPTFGQTISWRFYDSFLRIPRETREHVAGLLRLKVSPEHIVRVTSMTRITYFMHLFRVLTVFRWHHVLKDKFLHSKRNHRLDHLLNTLIHSVLPYYALKQRRQDLGLEGPDMEVQKRKDVMARSSSYTLDDVVWIEDDEIYQIKSQSDPSSVYDVDLEAYTCNCLDYPSILFCKHINCPTNS
ncbi:hypothetical protein R3P38DRAFT_2841210 [Favolaschia claudopus]|uniref:SWIM-type domain-containing protein n=1 Tax=Favolaschia claudopus TaxID=2862362 RepID=A0AAW0DZW4_9AGAR